MPIRAPSKQPTRCSRAPRPGRWRSLTTCRTKRPRRRPPRSTTRRPLW